MFEKWMFKVVCVWVMTMGWAASAEAGVGGHGAVSPHVHNTKAEEPAKAEAPAPEVHVGAFPVAGEVSVVMGIDGFAGGNVGVLSGPDGMLIVDDMLPGFEDKLEKVLDVLPKCETCGDLKYMVNTHWHFDHVGGNAHFGATPVLITHDSVYAMLANPQEIKAFDMKTEALPKAGLPDITISQRATVHFNGEEVRLTHYPHSHTAGDVAVYFSGSNVLHTGDLYFNGMFPFIDLEHGGNINGMIESVGALLKAYPQDVKIIPGHGPLSNMEELRAYQQMLIESKRIVGAAKASGKSLEEAQNAGLPEDLAKWAWPFVSVETWIALVYGSL